MKIKIATIFTCYNRIEKTLNAIESLVCGNEDIDFVFNVVDDCSTDGTPEALEKLKEKYMINLINGTGGLYYSKGMHLGMEYLKNNNQGCQYVLLINDDVMFYKQSIEKLIGQSARKSNAVIVGATENRNGKQSYGAIKYNKHSIHYKMLSINEANDPADTFNANCVLIPWDVFEKNEIMDNFYAHAAGDFDYGMVLSRNGTKIYSSSEYIGRCETNSDQGCWTDTSLSLLERLKQKESPKGLPFTTWFYYLNKHFGLGRALIYSIIPYIKIIIRR